MFNTRAIKVTLSTAAAFAAVALIVTGCGVKTAPVTKVASNPVAVDVTSPLVSAVPVIDTTPIINRPVVTAPPVTAAPAPSDSTLLAAWRSTIGAAAAATLGTDVSAIGTDATNLDFASTNSDCVTLRADVVTIQGLSPAPVASVQNPWAAELADLKVSADFCELGTQNASAADISIATSYLRLANGYAGQVVAALNAIDATNASVSSGSTGVSLTITAA